jgi:hypothetical protein
MLQGNISFANRVLSLTLRAFNHNNCRPCLTARPDLTKMWPIFGAAMLLTNKWDPT